MTESGIAGAQRQIHRVTAQDDGVFNGCHIVGVVGAAPGAEHLHGENLSVRRHTLHQDGLQGAGKAAVPLGNVGIGSCNAGYMGTVVSLTVFVMGDLQAAVDVVIAKGNLGVDIEVLRLELDRYVQLPGQGGDFFCVQQMEALYIGVCVLSRQLCPLGQGVGKGLVGEGLVVGVNAGVDHGNPAARAGVAAGPGSSRADHVAGCGHIGGVRLVYGVYRRVVPVFQNDLPDAGQRLNGRQLAVGDVGGDEVGCQGQIPDHIQPVAGGPLDAGGHTGLLLLQRIPVGHGAGVGRDAGGGVAGPDGGSPVQYDGYPDQVCVGIIRSLGFRLRCFRQKALGGCAACRLLKGQGFCLAALFCPSGPDGEGETGQKRKHQHQRYHTCGHAGLFHKHSPLRFGLPHPARASQAQL
ncbi:unknown [Firmicutes bacterium CAG:137]|nr:unknown [Firmicutes bacterium CAG:137]